ncbi:hypothetical protein TeGR_g8545, partial [Tetraparma gracilis]
PGDAVWTDWSGVPGGLPRWPGTVESASTVEVEVSFRDGTREWFHPDRICPFVGARVADHLYGADGKLVLLGFALGRVEDMYEVNTRRVDESHAFFKKWMRDVTGAAETYLEGAGLLGEAAKATRREKKGRDKLAVLEKFG